MDLNIPGLEDAVEIGRGGFATVYRAYQPAFRRTVAVKLLNGTDLDELSQERFRRECQAMGLLSEHPSIVTVLDAGFRPDGRAYMVMPFMPAGSLADRVRAQGPMPWADASRVAVKLAGALHAAHDAGVLHRDVKPANVLVSEYGEPKLGDFGIARVAGSGETQSGVVTASIAYAPPEVIDGERPTVRSDIYSLGATIYDLMAGRAPFRAEGDSSVASMLNRVLNDDPPDLVPLGVPAPLADTIIGAMAKDPAARPETAAAFGRQIRLAQDELGIKPTELTIVKVVAQKPAPTDIEPDEPTRSGPIVEEDAETVGLTADLPADGSDDDAWSTSDLPPSTPSQDPAPSGEATNRRRRRMVAAAVGVVALLAIVLAAGALFGGGDGPTDAGVESDGSATEPGSTADAANPPAGGVSSISTFDESVTEPAVFTPDDLCPDGLERPAGYPADGDLSGRSITEQRFECVDLSGANLQGADLSGSDLIGVDLSGADLRGATITGGDDIALWYGIDLSGAMLAGATLHVHIQSTDLRGVVFEQTDLALFVSASNADGVDFSDSTASTTDGPSVNFIGSSAVGADLTGLTVAPANHTDFTGADLSGSEIRPLISTFNDAILDGATLIGPFESVDLRGASTDGTTIDGAFTRESYCPDGSRPDDNLGECPVTG